MRRFVVGELLLGVLLLVPAGCGPEDSSEPTAVPDPGPRYGDPGIETFPVEGSEHVPVGSAVGYLTDPPTSGNHYPSLVEGGYYEYLIAAPYLVHSLEHGGVVIYYNPATVTGAQEDSLEALAQAHPGLYAQVICVPRDDPEYPVILTAWTHRLRLAAYDPARLDGFLALFLGRGPDPGPSAPWADPEEGNATATTYYTGSAHVLMITDVARPGAASTATLETYPASLITLSVDMKISGDSGLADSGSIRILDATSGAVLAGAVYDGSTGRIYFSIGATSYSPVAVSTGGFHAVTFHVDADDKATWSVEGTSTQPARPFGTPTIRLGLRADYASGAAAAPTFFFGNLLVGSP